MFATTFAGTAAVVYKNESATVLREPTAEESYILTGLKNAGVVDDSPLWLNCEADESRFIEPDGSRFNGRVKHNRYFDYIPVMHVRQPLCDEVIGYANNPDKSNPTPEQAQALQVVLTKPNISIALQVMKLWWNAWLFRSFRHLPRPSAPARSRPYRLKKHMFLLITVCLKNTGLLIAMTAVRSTVIRRQPVSSPIHWHKAIGITAKLTKSGIERFRYGT